MYNHFFTILLVQRAAGGGKYGAPYDSTQGVPGIVFVVSWIIILAFLIRIGWEYRDKLFKSKDFVKRRK